MSGHAMGARVLGKRLEALLRSVWSGVVDSLLAVLRRCIQATWGDLPEYNGRHSIISLG